MIARTVGFTRFLCLIVAFAKDGDVAAAFISNAHRFVASAKLLLRNDL